VFGIVEKTGMHQNDHPLQRYRLLAGIETKQALPIAITRKVMRRRCSRYQR
jgi:hypothetical protein